MSLYIEAAAILESALKGQGTLKSLTYSNKSLKNKPGHVYALVSQAAKWAAVLKEVIERSEFLGKERKLTPALALLLTHDLLLTKSGVAAPTNHPLRIAISKHKVRLQAELTKLRVRKGLPSLDELRAWVEREAGRNPDLNNGVGAAHPRWVRINSVKTTLEKQLATTFKEYSPADDLSQVIAASDCTNRPKIYYLDRNVPLLLALPPRTNITTSPAYINGELILQDKASCFPAVLLGDLDPNSDVVDGCAAPGNKTSQLGEKAFNIAKYSETKTGPKVYAFEKDPHRAKILHKMLDRAGLQDWVTIKPAVDFLTSDPHSKELRNVSALLLDPSCSGSGIVNRDGHLKIELPSSVATPLGRNASRKPAPKPTPNPPPSQAQGSTNPSKQNAAEAENEETLAETDPDALADRLASLSSFQLKIIQHAMSFPAATRISYSTCSIHCEENEDVVLKALSLPIARERGWKIWTRQAQPDGLKTWDRRGLPTWPQIVRSQGRKEAEGRDLEEIAEGCIRCAKDSPADGTMGFFLAGFVRDRTEEGNLVAPPLQAPPSNGETPGDADEDGDEWEGFSESD